MARRALNVLFPFMIGSPLSDTGRIIPPDAPRQTKGAKSGPHPGLAGETVNTARRGGAGRPLRDARALVEGMTAGRVTGPGTISQREPWDGQNSLHRPPGTAISSINAPVHAP